MTGGKVIVTYKRKRPPPVVAYKRRRLPNRDELQQKNESSGLNLAQTSVEQKVESTTINEWECHEEGLKHAPEEKGQMFDSMKEEQGHLEVAVNASESEIKNQTTPKMVQLVAEQLAVLTANPEMCLKEDGFSGKHAPEVKAQIFDPVKGEQGHLAVAVKASESEDANQNTPNMTVPEPHTALNANPGICLKEDGLSGKHAPKGKGQMFDSINEEQGDLAIAVKTSESENKNQNTPNMTVAEPLAVFNANPRICLKEDGLAGKRALEEIGLMFDSTKEEQSRLAVAVKSSGSENMVQLVAEPLAVLKANPGVFLKEDGLSGKNEASSSCSDAAAKRQVDPSLLTYQRRCKRKKDVNELQHGVNHDVSSGSTISIFAQEAAQSKSGSVHLLIARTTESSCPDARSPCESECFKLQADNKLKTTRSEDTSSVDIHTQIAEVSPCSLDKNSGLDYQEDSVGNPSNCNTAKASLNPVNFGLKSQGPLVNTSNNATVDHALNPVNSGCEFQEDLLGNSSNDATVDPVLEPVNPALELQEGPLGNKSNNATCVPAVAPISSGLEFLEGTLGNSSNNDTVHLSLDPESTGLEIQEGPLGNSSNIATDNPALKPFGSGLDFQEGPLGNASNKACTTDHVLEFPEGPLGNSSNNATAVPAPKPVNSGLEHQEDRSSNNAVNPALEPISIGLEFQEGALGNKSINASTINHVLEFQEGPLGNSSNGATVDPSLDHVNSGVEFQEDPLSNNSTIGPSLKPVNCGLEYREGPLGKSSKNAIVDPALEPVLFNKHSSTGEESVVLSGDAPTTGVTDEIPCNRALKESLDLSVPPLGGCDSTSAHGENTLCISLDARSEEPNALVKVESPVVEGSDLLHEKKSETAVIHSHHQVTHFSSAGTSRRSYLQLFPEKSMEDLSQSTKMHERDTAGSSSRTSGHDRTVAEAKSPLLYGLLLPMEVINDGHKYNSTSSQWPVGGIPFRDLPAQPSSSQRRRRAVARTPKRNRLNPASMYGYPTMWSEEELDSLWIGVRRYGRGNWEVMLRDPRLAFAPLRTPWDLALQWEQEQSKLLNNIPSVEGRQFRQSTVLQGMIGRQQMVEGVNLSLGDVYTGASLQNNAPRYQQQTVISMKPIPDADSSASANSSTGRNCPHWLKELVAHPPMPKEDTAAILDQKNRAEVRGSGAHTSNKGDLIVIDSGASSEDTISDDRGAKE